MNTTKLLVLFSNLFLAVSVSAQSWREYSEKEVGFTLEAPSPFVRVAFFEGMHGIAPEKGSVKRPGLECFASAEKAQGREYGIVVIDTKKLTDPEDKMDADHKTTDGFEFLIGGDDNEPTTIKKIVNHGHVGRELVYSQEIRKGVFTRGRVFESNSRYFVLVFRARRSDDLFSSAANRFLNSFRLL